MFATLITVALFAASTLTGVVADDFTIETPTLTQCGKSTISWDKNQGAVNVILVKAAEPCGEIIRDFGDFTNNTFSWTADLAPGTEYVLSAENQDGDEAWSKSFTIAKSDDTSCLKTTASSSASVSHTPATSSSSVAHQTIAAAGAAVTGGSTPTDDGDSGDSTGPLGAAGQGSSGAAALHMSPIMVLCALFAVALAL
ncbi:hypothetical protein DFH08DRAFT_838374 [Mycena albidolilacea]|uniref:Uncharacterized protein n=1 Tax=Mycena albidolilacea TaxID=1033008 RepID=A0AAD7ANQ6_9AGAR|nr:hypothetical protein DFH08DRAFT_838374 [Mycena albidolilacea]